MTECGSRAMEADFAFVPRAPVTRGATASLRRVRKWRNHTGSALFLNSANPGRISR